MRSREVVRRCDRSYNVHIRQQVWEKISDSSHPDMRRYSIQHAHALESVTVGDEKVDSDS